VSTCSIWVDQRTIRPITGGWECDVRDRGSVLTSRASGEKVPSDGTTCTECVGSLPGVGIGRARGDGVDAITYQRFLGSVYDHHFERQSVPVPRQNVISLAAVSQGDSPSELSAYRDAKPNNK